MTYCAAVAINESVNNKPIFYQLVVSIAVPQGIGVRAEIFLPTDDSTLLNEMPDTVNTFQ